MVLNSKIIGKNIYEMTDGTDTLIYAPFKNLVVPKWKMWSAFQRVAMGLVPNQHTIPQNTLKPTVLELDMSHRCNLDCIYCLVNSNNKDKEVRMSLDLAKIAIDRIIENSQENKDPFAIVFIGKGEPTLNWEVLVRCVKYIKNQREKCKVKGKIITVTNGIINVEKARWLARNMDHIALSWDGDSTTQNFQRPFLFGDGDSYFFVERTASILRDEAARFEIRATWTNFNVHKMVDFTKMFVTYRPFQLNYQPLLKIGRAVTSGLSKPLVDVFVDGFMESRKIANAVGVEVIMPSAETKKLNRKFCHAYEGTGFHLSANGFITACECVFSDQDGRAGELLVYGRVENGMIKIDEQKLSRLKSIKVDRISTCRECFARWHCAGGCLNTHLQYSSNPIDSRTHPECKITKQIVWRILKMLTNRKQERR